MSKFNDSELSRKIDDIIVAWRGTPAYWSLPMEQSEGNMPPDCYSLNGRTGSGKPGGDCHTCPFAQFGSDAKGEGQACKQVRQLFFVREENLLPEIVSLPVTSMKPARQYFVRLASKAVPCYSLITKIGLEKTKNAQGIVYSRAIFASGGRLSPQQTARVKEYAAMMQPFLESTPPVPISKDVPNGHGDGEVV
jgi:hypothetical protein